MTLPLAPFTVIDLTRARSGPTCVRQLADMGRRRHQGRAAREDVEGDFARARRLRLPEPAPQQALDHARPEGARGRRDPQSSSTKADVVVENFRPDVKHAPRHRLRDALARSTRAWSTRSISGFGQDGPYRDRPGYDQIAQGMGGLMSVTGLPGQGPCASASRSPT